MEIAENFSNFFPTKSESTFLKFLAIFFMTVDHIGLILFPEILWLRIVGRLAFPLFAYQFAVSINLTKHLKKMGINLFIFALISQPIFSLINKNFFELNIFFTLFIAWLIMYLYKNINNMFLRFLSLIPIFTFLLLPIFIQKFPEVDYGIYGVLILISFTFFIKAPLIMNFIFIFLTLVYCFFTGSYSNIGSYLQIFCLFSIPLFFFRIPIKIKFSNILFYIYYPLHLTILFILLKILKIGA